VAFIVSIPILLLAIGRRYDPPPHGWGDSLVILSEAKDLASQTSFQILRFAQNDGFQRELLDDRKRTFDYGHAVSCGGNDVGIGGPSRGVDLLWPAAYRRPARRRSLCRDREGSGRLERSRGKAPADVGFYEVDADWRG
jgi:hypothetical protein